MKYTAKGINASNMLVKLKQSIDYDVGLIIAINPKQQILFARNKAQRCIDICIVNSITIAILPIDFFLIILTPMTHAPETSAILNRLHFMAPVFGAGFSYHRLCVWDENLWRRK